MSTARYIEEDQVPGPGGRWIAAPPLPPQEIGTTAAAADGVSTTTAANPTPLLLFRAYRRSFPGQQHRQHDSYVWIEVDSSSLVVLEPLRKTFPTLGTLYDPKPAVRFDLFSFSSPVVFTREKGAKREADMTRLLDVFTFPTIPPHRSISAPFTPTPTSFSRMQLS
jgi:hypothetical protein